MSENKEITLENVDKRLKKIEDIGYMFKLLLVWIPIAILISTILHFIF